MRFDCIVVGAGFAGLYSLYKCKNLGLSCKGIEAGDDVGGTWYWNRYPGARCDVESLDYSFKFDDELTDQWQWSERFATQPEIQSYLSFVAYKFDLRKEISFSTRLIKAIWDERNSLWEVETDSGEKYSCKYLIMASGALSHPKEVDIPGIENFKGEVYSTNKWPKEKVSFEGKRVAVIGTGSSGIQVIPEVAKEAKEAKEVVVFQRTPSYTIPARNGPVRKELLEKFRNNRKKYYEEVKKSRIGILSPLPVKSFNDYNEKQRIELMEKAWEIGSHFPMHLAFSDMAVNPEANRALKEFVDEKIRGIVKDPKVAEAFIHPKDHVYGTRRVCCDTNFYETFNLPYVRLVNLKEQGNLQGTESGLKTDKEEYAYDMIILALGFDAVTGSYKAPNVIGKSGFTLTDKWKEGPKTYLGLMAHDFPNYFMITGPQSPSIFTNMVPTIEQHVDWTFDLISFMEENDWNSINPSLIAEEAWFEHANDFVEITLHKNAISWYYGSNIPGKKRAVLGYLGGLGYYTKLCTRVKEQNFLGFEFENNGSKECHDGIIHPLKPDVALFLEAISQKPVPKIEDLTPEEARNLIKLMGAQLPPGPEVGEVIDGTLPVEGTDLGFRLYRPKTTGPHPIIVYYHGGGWVLGDQTTDDSFCRLLCNQTDAIVVSSNYRHAPEYPWPTPVEDAYQAAEWVFKHAKELGGIEGCVSICGFSAGGNLAAVVAQKARDENGPEFVAQGLINPVTDCDFTRQSYQENGEGFILEKEQMEWYWNHYCKENDRKNPTASPIYAKNLSKLPPTVVTITEFDPLRDDGREYAEALKRAGNEVTVIECKGQIHNSMNLVGVIRSIEKDREAFFKAFKEAHDIAVKSRVV